MFHQEQPAEMVLKISTVSVLQMNNYHVIDKQSVSTWVVITVICSTFRGNDTHSL